MEDTPVAQAKVDGSTVCLKPGLHARADGMLYIAATRSLLVADVHLAYEDGIGAALPLLSLAEIERSLNSALHDTQAEEMIFLGDIVHTTQLSMGAGEQVQALFTRLRDAAAVTCLAGNHEGRSRGRALFGTTFESVERAGWHLLHGDDVSLRGARNGRPMPAIIGHFHPSLHLGGGRSVPVFAHVHDTVLMPALAPYSPGLEIRSDEGLRALKPWLSRPASARIVACTGNAIYDLGALGTLRDLARTGSGTAARR